MTEKKKTKPLFQNCEQYSSQCPILNKIPRNLLLLPCKELGKFQIKSTQALKWHSVTEDEKERDRALRRQGN